MIIADPDCIQFTSLIFTEGSSNKQYDVYLEQTSADTYSVHAYYGKRGCATNHAPQGTGLTLEQAQKLFAKTVSGKTRKGYQLYDCTTRDGVTAPALIDRNDTGMRPQLLNPCDATTADLLTNHLDVVCQEKQDGERRMVRFQNGTITCANRTGYAVPCPAWLESEIAATDPQISFVIDGELIGPEQHYYVFDLLEYNGQDLRPVPYGKRLSLLETLGSTASWTHTITVVETFRTPKEKAQALIDLKVANAEGIVYKNLLAPFTAGRATNGGDQRKLKFLESITARVGLINQQRSIGLTMFDNGVPVFAGNVTVKANQRIPDVGAYVEVRYLYATALPPDGALYQPELLSERSDVSDADCEISTITRLKP